MVIGKESRQCLSRPRDDGSDADALVDLLEMPADLVCQSGLAQPAMISGHEWKVTRISAVIEPKRAITAETLAER